MARTRLENPLVAWVLRAFLILNALSCTGFIIYAVVLQNPPKSALPVGLIVVGSVGLANCFIGFCGSFYRHFFLNIYLFLGVLITLAELGIILSLFFNTDNVVSNIMDVKDPNWKANPSSADDTRTKVETGRWVFLAIIILQVLNLIAGAVMRFFLCTRDRDYDNMEEGAAGAPSKSQIQMENLKASVAKRETAATSPGSTFYASSSRINKSVTKKMAEKYGDYQSDFKKQTWWQKMFG